MFFLLIYFHREEIMKKNKKYVVNTSFCNEGKSIEDVVFEFLAVSQNNYFMRNN